MWYSDQVMSINSILRRDRTNKKNQAIKSNQGPQGGQQWGFVAAVEELAVNTGEIVLPQWEGLGSGFRKAFSMWPVFCHPQCVLKSLY